MCVGICQVLFEDENTNRMDEALTLFEQICNHPSFKKTSMILFLNKVSAPTHPLTAAPQTVYGPAVFTPPPSGCGEGGSVSPRLPPASCCQTVPLTRPRCLVRCVFSPAQRDLFEIKLKKKNLTCWRDIPELQAAGQDYDKCMTYLKSEFLALNKEPEVRQVYVHATCATDTNNIAFVMESVFDIILKDNLRKLAVGDVDSMLELASGSGVSGVATGPGIWKEEKQGKIILAACFYTDNLSERKVLVTNEDTAALPGVQVGLGLSVSTTDWDWVMGLGKMLPTFQVFGKEAGSFKGDFKEAATKLRELLGDQDLGFVYDSPICMTAASGARTTILACVRTIKSSAGMFAAAGKWVEHEEFENACYKKFDNKDTAANPCMPPDKNAEFNPFAPNPVGFRWFKGITLFSSEVQKTPDCGVYLGIFKVLSAAGGFKVMVNEHNRISIPLIFLTETQLDEKDTMWMHGVRTREEAFNIDLLEGKQPNRGWLGPEMSGEEGATFPEKLWWAIDEAKARLDTDDIGKQYDKELLFIDEENNIQLLLFGVLAKDATDLLPGHIWVDKQVFLRENMKYLCPRVLQGMIKEQQKLIEDVMAKSASDSLDMAAAAKMREEKGKAKEALKAALAAQTPLKWVDRTIMWCADKMPSFTDGCAGADADARVKAALEKDTATSAAAKARAALIEKYGK